MKKYNIFTVVFVWLLLLFSTGYAQDFPFPVNTTYNYGLMPEGNNHQEAMDAYNFWHDNYVEDCGGGELRVMFDDMSQTVSEGIAYGMLLSAYAGDQTTFDGLWAYYQNRTNGNGVMHWKIDGCTTSPIDEHGATDAELDAAMALYIAHWQWGEDYLSQCENMIQIIKDHEITGRVLKPGDQFGGSHLVNPSYFSPAYYRVFGEITGETQFWNEVAAEGYNIIDNAMHQTTGFVPDWCQTDGSFAPEAGNLGYHEGGEHFYYDAIRVPWRSAVDYLWHGNQNAKAYCEKVSDYVRENIGITQVGTEYEIDGTELTSDHNNTFVGCFGVAAMATDRAGSQYQQYVNDAYNENVTVDPNAQDSYFNATLKALTLFNMTGNFYMPPPDECESPDFGGEDFSLCLTGDVTLETGLSTDSRTFTWYRDGSELSGASGPSHTTSDPGLYQVKVDKDGCIRRDKAEVHSGNLNADFNFIDDGLTVTFTNLSTGGENEYEWIFGDDGTSAEENPVHSFSVPGLHEVTLNITDTCGQTASVTKEITVGSLDAAGGWVTNDFGDGQKVFTFPEEGDSDNITLSTTCSELLAEINTADEYEVFGFIFAEDGQEKPQDLSGYPYVRVRMKSDTQADSLRVDIADTTSNCDGNPCSTSEEPLFLENIPGDNEYHVYTLDFEGKFTAYDGGNSTPVDSANIVQFTITPNNPDYNLDFSGNITIDWMIVGNERVPEPDVTIADDYVCGSDETVELDASNCHATSYEWSTGQTTPTIQAGTGEYTVYTTNFGGTDTTTVTVEERAAPVAGFTYEQNDLDVSFTDASANYIGTRSWTFGDGGTSSLPDPSHTYESYDTYDACLEVTNGCGTDSTCKPINLVTGLASPQNTGNLKLYPVPAESRVYVEGDEFGDGEARVTVTDAMGQTVKNVTKSVAKNKLSVNLAPLKSGVYLLKVEQDGKVFQKRFLKNQ